MSQRNLITTVVDREGVQRAAPELRAEGAGAAFLAIFKHDLADVGIFHIELNADALCKRLNAGDVLLLETQIQHDGDDLKLGMGKLLIELHRLHQQQGILAAGDADANLVSVFNHMIPLIRAANAAQYTFHEGYYRRKACTYASFFAVRRQAPHRSAVAAPSSTGRMPSRARFLPPARAS